ncbi:unnamed protein product [Thlaspi arvense]|uniref:Uncharacterized protein n=1 Tax=Thlaspi arvense TaxID=13288 RepID=A0AAU9RRN6_THLAR|nr:unnamed protein product [Thlaspi arvense]
MEKASQAEVSRRTANFHPTVWGKHFLTHTSEAQETEVGMEDKFEQLREQVGKILQAEADKPSEKLKLIDAVERLGLSYHFETEIEAALQRIYEEWQELDDDKEGGDLYTVSLWFRLLRQQRYPISSGPSNVFERFKDGDGNFKESLIGDVRGMLSLYEAAHLGIRGEKILDEAVDFTTSHLRSMLPNLSSRRAAQVRHALNQTIRRGVPRLEARFYISFYEAEDSHDKVLLSLAKLDFNLLQKMHQRELRELTMWWEDLKIAEKLPFARDRLVECYFWIWAVYFEPKYCFARMILSSVTSLTSLLDDIYDVHGTLEEITLLTEAFQRWEMSASDQLPEYMKPPFQAYLNLFSVVEKELALEGRSYRADYAKFVIKDLVKAYLEEAKWFHEGRVPTMEEYMRVALVTSCYKMLATVSYVGMGEIVTKETFDWVCSDPLIVRASSLIARVMNDIVAHKFEQERGHPPSAVEVYMNEHGASEEEALVELQKLITNAWKDINAEFLHRPTTISTPILMRILNFTRFLDVVYKGEDRYTHSQGSLKDFATLVFDKPLPI